VLVSDKTRLGVVFAPMHWSAETSSGGLVNAIAQAHVDPVSGQPELKGGAVQVRRWRAAWHGFAAAAAEFRPTSLYWARARTKTGWRAELADLEAPGDWEAYARDLFSLPHADCATVTDPSRGTARVALMQGGRVAGALFVARDPVAVSRGHVVAQLAEIAAAPGRMLAGRAGADRPDPGAILCACFDVGVNTILAAIANQGLADVAGIGAALQAGTNCGSCRPELQALLAAARAPEAAQ
jgi:assimilatory nitrate reductase catalytic subunit